ncbi:DUF5979 domain-containing protein [Corynebacterium pseudotuberculosis]|uniref:DUF5979 domain-containing protein n=1 Tax=Corynebacterium pseudotuberculosis TaxID=1719 RepID=UPI0004D7405C|nr:DUF5979 domain-containing protein [Corynebacterium pseudotuberculosis]AKS12529.1 Hypothetical protein CpE19_0186 [Corynebacterium pseudotuberculosis]APB22403.1 hypothetical protein A4R64_00950 [Corynebacterium pseudotuberculosis]APB24417.1 hypothetical protein A4R63_00950 [Corynebacterium pseudotuberculosis]APB26461.1 hypothetical protein A4R62_01165 [Corynebacterium pseudotuberculosis]APQ55369.1 Hypothetical protein CpMEX31_0200 [Corynebacterium pseudotuberculosis]
MTANMFGRLIGKWQQPVKSCKLAISIAGIIALIFTSVVASPLVPLARAENTCVGTISGLKWHSSYHLNGDVFEGGYQDTEDVEFQWSVDRDAKSGDSFTLQIPEQLRPIKNTMELLSPDNQVVAKGTYSASTKKWTFVLTDYADKNGDISGSAWFTVAWDRNLSSPNTSYSLEFNGCRGSGTLNGKTPEEGAEGVFQASGKTGILRDGGEKASWAIYVATAHNESYKPLVIRDKGGDGFVLTCDQAKVFNRTPYPYTEIRDTEIDKNRWSCVSDGERGIVISMKPDSEGRYLYEKESLMIQVESTVSPFHPRRLINKVDLENAPDQESHIEGEIDTGGAGGVGAGFQAKLRVKKEVKGEKAPSSDTLFDFTYTCGSEKKEISVKSGEVSAQETNKSSAICELIEKKVDPDAKVTFKVETTSGSPVYTEETKDGIRIAFNKNSETEVLVTAINTYPDNPLGGFRIEKDVEGLDADARDKEFSFNYVCTTADGQKKSEKVVVSATKPWASGSTIPYGSKCVVEEDVSTAEIQGYTLQSMITPSEITINTDSDAINTFKAKNTYKKNVGGFKVTKKVTGEASQLESVRNKDFSFTYQCGSAPQKTFLLKEGETKQVEDLIEGSKCTISEDQMSLPQGTLWRGEITGEGIDNGSFTISKDKVLEFVAENNYSLARGGFSIAKVLTGDGVTDELSEKPYEFDYACTGIDGKKISSSVKVKAGETKHVTDIPVHSMCEVSEKAVQVPDAEWKYNVTGEGVTVLGEGAEQKATFKIREAGEPSVTLTAENNYTKYRNKFSIKKAIVDQAALLGTINEKQFTFQYQCGTDAPRIVKASVSNPYISEQEYPVGTECTVSELEKDTNIDGFVWDYQLSPADGKITIGKDHLAAVTVTNLYTPVPKGRFSVVKKLEGPESVLSSEVFKNKKFDFEYKCGDSAWTPFTASVNEPFKSPEFVDGTKCEVREDSTTGEVAGYNWTHKIDKPQFSIHVDDEEVQVIATNHYEPVLSEFVIEKQLQGAYKDKAREKEFIFDYVCYLDGQQVKDGILKITGEGQSEPVTGLKPETKCTITERDASISGASWTHRIAGEGNIVITEHGKTYKVTAVNAYSKPDFPWFIPLVPIVIIPIIPIFPHPTPAPQPPQKPSDQQPAPKTPEEKPQKEKKVLARTGANVWMFIVIAALLVLLGVFLRRRGNK